MAETLNIKADKIIGKHASIPKSIYIRNTIMVVYINKTYILNKIRREIINHCGVQEAARFLKEKYKWTQQTLDDFELEMHSVFIQKQTYSRKKTTTKYIHRWLPSGSKCFDQNLGCYYCDEDGSKHNHDYFITCEFAGERKEVRIKEITEKLNVLLIPTEISDGICRGINNYYHTTTRKEKS